jgi:hypothetical protein
VREERKKEGIKGGVERETSQGDRKWKREGKKVRKGSQYNVKISPKREKRE